MIVGIEGDIEQKEQTSIDVNVQGIIYRVHLSINSTNAIDTKRVKLFITQIIREDAHQLFGFVEKSEQKMFDTLLKINGVGPKVALAICSTFTPATFSQVISTKDVTMLKRVPGIGPKAASRILVELADFIVDDSQESQSATELSQAVMALESLGFKPDAIKKALTGCSGDTPSLVKEGLKRLQRL